MPNISCQSISKTEIQLFPLAERLPKTIPSPQTSQNTLLSWHCPSERQEPAPPTRSQAQVLPTRKPSQATVPNHSWRADFTIKRNYNPLDSSLQKGDPKHSKLNKMKKQKNMQQMKEYGKNPWDPTNEQEISSLLEKEFRVTIVKMIPSLENTMEAQINRLEIHIEKIQKMFNKELYELKK